MARSCRSCGPPPAKYRSMGGLSQLRSTAYAGRQQCRKSQHISRLRTTKGWHPASLARGEDELYAIFAASYDPHPNPAQTPGRYRTRDGDSVPYGIPYDTDPARPDHVCCRSNPAAGGGDDTFRRAIGNADLAVLESHARRRRVSVDCPQHRPRRSDREHGLAEAALSAWISAADQSAVSLRRLSAGATAGRAMAVCDRTDVGGVRLGPALVWLWR